MTSEEKRQHLEFLQNVITRMNKNSFQIKSLCISIVSAFLAVYASSSKIVFIFLAIFPSLIFWFLDSYYLLQERKFRGIYNDLAGLTQNNVIRPYEMPLNKYNGNCYSYLKVLFSKTILPIYLSIIILLSLFGVILIVL